jgi:hypothetical protein
MSPAIVNSALLSSVAMSGAKREIMHNRSLIALKVDRALRRSMACGGAAAFIKHRATERTIHPGNDALNDEGP